MTTGNWRIDQIIAQMGGLGFHGAFGWIGASNIMFKDREDMGTPDSSQVYPSGIIDFQTGLQFNVNGKRGWKIIVSLEPSDTYTVRLWAMSARNSNDFKAGIWGKVLHEETDVYCEELQSVVEKMYDEMVKTHLNGVIPW